MFSWINDQPLNKAQPNLQTIACGSKFVDGVNVYGLLQKLTQKYKVQTSLTLKWTTMRIVIWLGIVPHKYRDDELCL